MKKAKKPSPAIQLLDLVYGNANKGTSHSWERLNHAMHAALRLVVGAGFVFDENDMKHVAGEYRSGYWVGACVEWVYAEAVAVGNASAVKSFETWVGREPFIADDVSMSARSGYTHGGNVCRTRERLTVGSEFKWKGVRVTVTSFAEDSSYLTACSYKERKPGEYGDKIDKRFRITRADIIQDRNDRKDRAAMMKELTGIGEKCGNKKEIVEALGIKDAHEYQTLPVKKIKEVLKKFASENTEECA